MSFDVVDALARKRFVEEMKEFSGARVYAVSV